MTIGEIVRQGFHYARTCRSLWLFGFFVGLAGGGSSGGGRGDGSGAAAWNGLPGMTPALILPIAVIAIIVICVAMIMRFVGEGALIEGIVRTRRGGTMTTSEGFRAGWAHWGVLVRIALLYLAASIGSLALLAAPCIIAVQTIGPLAGALLGISAAIVGIPWLITLNLVQAFAWRIAVLENRQALDAIDKARLFLHGRLDHALKLLVASFVGTLAIVIVSVATLAPVVVLLVALIPILQVLPVVVLGCLVLLPLAYVLIAMLGTFRSSVWTIGYVTQVES